MTTQPTFRLRVRQVDQSCVFDLASADGQELSATVKYPATLAALYHNWQQIYGHRYQLTRARIGHKSGSGTPLSYDWDQELQIAETALLTSFNEWLEQSALLPIRETIQHRVVVTGKIPSRQSQRQPGNLPPVDVLLECSPIDLARLPWETWHLAPQGADPHAVRIARTCPTPVAPAIATKPRRHRKLRVLAILAASPDLNHDADQTALRSLHPLADIEFIDCRHVVSDTSNHATATTLKQRIVAAIADARGWDLLLFAGHSDEAATTGGKLELAPQIALSISEMEPQLIAACQRGLQLAVFNSCCGLHIADALIRLGLPQVVVMRERIQDGVAHRFLEQFCHSLSGYRDVHQAVIDATAYFAAEAIAYPSAYLIPSLFRHPDRSVALFQIEPSALKRLWRRWQPTRWEAIALATISFCSLLVPLQELLMEGRHWHQAVYRHATGQLPPLVPPTITLLKIDQASIDRKGIDAARINPISRAYLAELCDRLRQLQVRVIGVDYLLDGATQEDPALATVVQTAVQQGTWFVLASRRNGVGQPVRVNGAIAQPNWVLQGNVDVVRGEVMVPPSADCGNDCPFAYQLALAHLLRSATTAPQPQLASSLSLQARISQYHQRNVATDPVLAFLQSPVLAFNQQPLTDYSLPPSLVYQSMVAWDFLERPLHDATLQALAHQVVIIGSGGYDQADDNFAAPLAVQYWRGIRGPFAGDSAIERSPVLPGATTHAYNVHHLLTQHLIQPIPTIWILGIAAILGKGTTLLIAKLAHHQQRRWMLIMVGGTVAYGVICLQSYVTLALLLPWFLPSVLFWCYVLPALKRA